MTKQNFVPLNKLLLEDNEEIKKIKTLQKREEEYAYILGPIEHTIALHYSDNRKIKDRDVVKMLKNLRSNYSQNLDFFKEPLEKEIIIQLSFALQETETMHREIYLSISYIIWSIDNRTWTGDNRAYLEWVLNFFGMMDKKERKEFKRKYDELGKEFGIEEEKIRAMTAGSEELNEDIYEPSDEEEAWSKKDSEYFAMSDDEKCRHLLECDDKLESSKVLIDLINQMEAYFKNSNFAKIVQIADKIKDTKIEKKMREVIYSMKAEALICMKEYEKAENAAQELIEFSRNYPMGYFNRAVIRFHNNDLKGALEILDKTIEVAEKVNMRHFQYYMLKADILKKLGNEDYKKFEKLAQDTEKETDAKLKNFADEAGIDMEDFEEK
ncbi:hypothetical protein HYX00_06485 [Candidatus Woesearchaeota archaeon]|nr:hypothetical protein [Candidatus Woesearchaeota archaeon]